MSDTIRNDDFSARPGVDEWRVLHSGVAARYRTESLASAARFTESIAAACAGSALQVEVDVRNDSVTVRLPIRRDDPLTEDHATIAAAVSRAADTAALIAEPSALQTVQVALDAVDVPAVTAFWAAALGYAPHGHHLYDERGDGPTLFVQDKSWSAPRNRFHLDVSVPHDRAPERVAAILAAGGRVLGDRYAPAWWSLIDPEGNVVDVATWQGRDD